MNFTSLRILYIRFVCISLVACMAGERNRCLGQEYEGKSIPAPLKTTTTYPDEKMYGSALRQMAAMERMARQHESLGLDGGAFRRHLQKRFNINATEQQRMATLAFAYEVEYRQLRDQAQEIGRAFREQYFPNNRRTPGTPLPPRDPRLAKIKAQIDALTLAYRDRVHSSLGDAGFQRFHTALHARRAQLSTSTILTGGAR